MLPVLVSVRGLHSTTMPQPVHLPQPAQVTCSKAADFTVLSSICAITRQGNCIAMFCVSSLQTAHQEYSKSTFQTCIWESLKTNESASQQNLLSAIDDNALLRAFVMLHCMKAAKARQLTQLDHIRKILGFTAYRSRGTTCPLHSTHAGDAAVIGHVLTVTVRWRC